MYAIVVPALDPVAFHLGPVAVRWYALAYLVGFVAGWRYAVHLARIVPFRPSSADLDDYLTWAVLGTIVGGRLGYVLFYNLPFFLENPADALRVWEGGMSFHGGLIGVILSMILFAWRRGFSPFALGDIVSAATPIGLFFGRIANFVNGELYGRPSDLPWATVFWTDEAQMPRHPSQLYEAVAEGIVLFALLAFLSHRPAIRRRPGIVGGTFLVGYALCRFSVEFVREPDRQLGFLWLGATMGQLLSLPMMLVGLAFIAWALLRPPVTLADAPARQPV